MQFANFSQEAPRGLLGHQQINPGVRFEKGTGPQTKNKRKYFSFKRLLGFGRDGSFRMKSMNNFKSFMHRNGPELSQQRTEREELIAKAARLGMMTDCYY